MSLLVVAVDVVVDACEEIYKFLSRNWGICGRLKVFIVEASSKGAPRKYIEMHSQSQLKPSYKVTFFCTDKGKILKVTPTPTPTLTKLQFCTWETNVRDMHVCVCVWACICVAFPWNAIEIRDNIMPVNCCTRERKVKERGGGGGRRRGRGKETDESFHLPQCARQKQFSQLCFCAGPRLENELQVVWSRGMVGGGQQQQTTPYNNNKNKSKFNNGGHGCCCCCGCRWWWQSIQRTGL